MLLSMSMIAHQLKHHNPQFYINADDRPVLKSLKFLKQGQVEYEESFVYLASQGYLLDDLPVEGLLNIILPAQKDCILPKEIEQRCNLIVLDETLDSLSIFDEVQEIFETYRDWDHDLQEALIKDKGLQYIIDASYKIFNNPMYVIDSSFRTLAYTRDVSSDAIDHLWKSIVEEGHTDIATVNAMKENDALNWLNNCWEPVLNCSPIFTHPRINANIMNGSTKIGTLIVIGAFRELEKAHLHLAEYLRDILFLALQRDHVFQNTRGEIYNYFFADLIEGKITKKSFLKYQLQYLDWSIHDHYFILQVKMAKHDLVNNTLDFLAHQLENINAHSRSIIYNDVLVLIINCGESSTLDANYLDEAEKFIAANNLVAGLSSCCMDILEIRDYYLQAAVAIELGEIVGQDRSFYKYEDYVLYHLIHNSARKTDLYKICHPAVMKLLRHDLENQSDYYNTLRAYIVNDFNLVKSAKVLFIHRNTLVYRINRIMALINVELNAENVKNHILLSFKIIDYMGYPETI